MLGVPSMHFHITLILEVKSIHWWQSASRLVMMCFLNHQEQRDIHFQYIFPKFQVPWQPSSWDFWVPYYHEIQADYSNNKYAFIPVAGMVLLHQIMVPAVYSFVSWECVAGYDTKNTVNNKCNDLDITWLSKKHLWMQKLWVAPLL